MKQTRAMQKRIHQVGNDIYAETKKKKLKLSTWFYKAETKKKIEIKHLVLQGRK